MPLSKVFPTSFSYLFLLFPHTSVCRHKHSSRLYKGIKDGNYYVYFPSLLSLKWEACFMQKKRNICWCFIWEIISSQKRILFFFYISLTRYSLVLFHISTDKPLAWVKTSWNFEFLLTFQQNMLLSHSNTLYAVLSSQSIYSFHWLQQPLDWASYYQTMASSEQYV